MDITRQNKVSRLIQKDLSSIFMELNREHFQGKMISVTVVRVTADFSFANVYLSIFPSNNIQEILEKIEARNKQIRHILSQKVKSQLRKVPELRFFLDDSIDYANKIDELLNNK